VLRSVHTLRLRWGREPLRETGDRQHRCVLSTRRIMLAAPTISSCKLRADAPARPTTRASRVQMLSE
jgi:hypothetical protein